MFIGFINFYQHFTQNFSKIIISLISRLKTNKSSEVLAPKKFKAFDNEIDGGGDNRANETVKNSSKSKKSKNEKSGNSTRAKDIGAMGKPMFLTANARKAFNQLRQAFIKALIQLFDLESHIQIQINALSYVIGKVFS